MAGDWIPATQELPRKREVLTIAARTGRNRHEVVGILIEFWLWAQSETEDGRLIGMTVDVLTQTFEGVDAEFWDAMISVGWLLQTPEGLEVVRAERWLSTGAKARLNKNRRQERWRQHVRDHSVPRETATGKANGRPTKGTGSDAEFLAELKANPVYAGIDIDRELGLMDAWLSAHPGRQKTRRFVVNWLGKVDRPLPGAEPELTMWDTAPRVWACEGNPNCPEKGYHRAKNPKSVPVSKRCPLLPASEEVRP